MDVISLHLRALLLRRHGISSRTEPLHLGDWLALRPPLHTCSPVPGAYPNGRQRERWGCRGHLIASLERLPLYFGWLRVTEREVGRREGP